MQVLEGGATLEQFVAKKASNCRFARYSAALQAVAGISASAAAASELSNHRDAALKGELR